MHTNIRIFKKITSILSKKAEQLYTLLRNNISNTVTNE